LRDSRVSSLTDRARLFILKEITARLGDDTP